MAQYTIVANMVVVNLVLALSLPQGTYGQYSTLIAGALVIVQVTDGGINLAAVAQGRQVTPRSLLRLKAASGAAALLLITFVAAMTGEFGPVYWVTVFYALAWPTYTSAEIIALSRHEHDRVLTLRLLVASLSWLWLFTAAANGATAVELVFIQGAVHLAVASWALRGSHRAASLEPCETRTPRLGSLVSQAVLLGLPINLLSNGLLLVATVLTSSHRAAEDRLALLVVVGMLMLAPLSAPQVAAFRISDAQTAVQQLGERSALVLVTLAPVAALGSLAVKDALPDTVLSQAAGTCIAAALAAPAIQLGLWRVASLAVVSLARASLACASASISSVLALSFTPDHDLGTALAVMGVVLCAVTSGLRPRRVPSLAMGVACLAPWLGSLA